jgi:hypothetical protein
MLDQSRAAAAQGIIEGHHHQICGVAIANDVHMLSSYGIEIPSMYDLQEIVPNPTKNSTLSLYNLSNATIGINLEKKKRIKKDKKKDKKKNKKKDEKKDD